MHIDKFKENSGWYVDPKGCHWETAEDFLQGYVVGHCCCGTPEISLAYLRDVMALLRDKVDYDTRQAYFGSEGEQYTIYYMLDKLEFTEHGSSVPGWLTEKGKEFLDDVEELLPLNP